MGFGTKLRLTLKKFFQESGDTLQLSGSTNIYGNLNIESGATFTLKDNAGVNKVLFSDVQGNSKWEYLPEITNIKKTVTQNLHGFSVGDYIGWSNNQYSKAIADNTYDGEFVGFVSNIVDTNTFVVTQAGFMSGFTGLDANYTYYLSDVTAGDITTGKTTVIGHIIKPTLVATSPTEGWVLPYVGSYVIDTGDTITFTGSVVQSGSTVMLVGDVMNPSGNSYYGTDENGVRGWHELPDPIIDVTAVTGTYEATIDDDMVVVSTTNSGATVNLPTNDLYEGYRIYIKDYDGNAGVNPIIVDATTGYDIDGSQSGSINTSYGSVELIYVGNNKWSVVSIVN